MASELFSEGFRDNVSLDVRLDVDLPEPTVLLLKILHPRHERHVNAAVLAAPFIKRRRTDPVLSAQIQNRRTGLGLLKHCQDLTVGKSQSLHVKLPPTRKFYLSDPQLSGGIALQVKGAA
jgi:hypothetical protein